MITEDELSRVSLFHAGSVSLRGTLLIQSHMFIISVLNNES